MLAYILTRVTPRLRSHELARRLGMRPMLVCDNLYQAEALMRQPYRLPADNIIVVPGAPGPPTGAAFKRDYVCRKVATEGEWMLWLDDNVSAIHCLRPGLSEDVLPVNPELARLCPPDVERRFMRVDWRAEFSRPATRGDVWRYVREVQDEADSRGTIACGFSADDNYYFLGRKWQYFGYCRGQFMLYKNDGTVWMPTPNMMFEDFYKTVDIVARYGCVVLNRHLRVIKPRFEPGGVGSLEERIPHLTANCRWLMENYPGLLRASKGRPYHVTFAKRNFKTVNQWRREHGFL